MTGSHMPARKNTFTFACRGLLGSFGGIKSATRRPRTSLHFHRRLNANSFLTSRSLRFDRSFLAIEMAFVSDVGNYSPGRTGNSIFVPPGVPVGLSSLSWRSPGSHFDSGKSQRSPGLEIGFLRRNSLYNSKAKI